MSRKLSAMLAALLAATLSPVAVHAEGPAAPPGIQAADARFQADRRYILAMAGNFRVRFDFRETTAWQPGYQPIESKVTGGNEVVRVIEDSGRVIRLQHLLVVEHEGKTHVIKHWRQDWTYEPQSVLVYAGQGKWAEEEVPEQLRKGRWAQTVWQTDDSPRYGGWGEWTDEGGVPRWRSNWTWRPLARRDATRNPPYDRYRAINRHSPTPTGWIHWQDNIKLGMKDGRLVPFVQEAVLNSYDRSDAFNVKAADDYWAKTSAYWAQVRAGWEAVIARGNGVSVKEVADTGSAGAERLMQAADDVASGKLKLASAVKQAQTTIAEVTAERAASR